MSKPMKEMIVEEYRERVGDYEDALVISLRGIDSNATNAIRAGLAEKEIRVTVVRNSLFPRAFEGSKLAGLEPILTGQSVLAYGAESVVHVAREIVGLLKTYPDIELKGAILDGDLFEGDAGVKRLSDFPTREEAIAQNITLILSPARNLVGQVKGPGSGVVGLVKAIQDKLEKGEEIARVS